MYNFNSMVNKLIIVAGCSGSGKTTVAKKIKASFNKRDAQILCMDRFYKAEAKLMPKVKKSGNPNFDHPDSFDWKLLRQCLNSLLNNKKTLVPSYDYKNHRRTKKWDLLQPTRVIILEGFLALFDDGLNKLAELKVYVDTSMDECFIRRLHRDQKERRRTVESIVRQWTESVKPMYDMYVKPRRWVADFLIPWDKHNSNSIKYLISAIKSQLRK